MSQAEINQATTNSIAQQQGHGGEEEWLAQAIATSLTTSSTPYPDEQVDDDATFAQLLAQGWQDATDGIVKEEQGVMPEQEEKVGDQPNNDRSNVCALQSVCSEADARQKLKLFEGVPTDEKAKALMLMIINDPTCAEQAWFQEIVDAYKKGEQMSIEIFALASHVLGHRIVVDTTSADGTTTTYDGFDDFVSFNGEVPPVNNLFKQALFIKRVVFSEGDVSVGHWEPASDEKKE